MTSNQEAAASRSLPELPAEMLTVDGYQFSPQSDVWTVYSLTSGKFSFDFHAFSNLTHRARHCLKLVLCEYLCTYSFSHTLNNYSRFKAFYLELLHEKSFAVDTISLGNILSYRATLTDTTVWKLAIIRGLLKQMEDYGIGITDRDALNYLNDTVIRGNPKGTSIRTRDPNDGAFDESELLRIQSALNDAYGTGQIAISDFAASWLFLAYGSRPVQIAALKETDLTVVVDGMDRSYSLRMPRAKQRGGTPRASFKANYCSKQVGLLLEKLIATNKAQRDHYGLVGEDWPMFMADKPGELPDLQYHVSSKDLGKRVAQVINELTDLKSNVKRFRITLGQRAADDGKDIHTLAALLDHSDTQNVGVYYEASPKMALRLDRHLALEMAPIAQAFAGVVIETERDARRGSDTKSRIFDRSLNNAESRLGNCGQMSFCGLAVPFACYTCRHFQPWIDGPHEEFLDALVADRERMIAEEISPKIYTIRDRTILAVAEVIRLCARPAVEAAP